MQPLLLPTTKVFLERKAEMSNDPLTGLPVPRKMQPFFAIRHKPTGHTIPCANGRMDRGGSWVEPCDPRVIPPRVWSASKYAKGWLTSWCKGAVQMDWYTDFESGHQEGRTTRVAKPHRKREEYEICPVYFRFGKAIK